MNWPNPNNNHSFNKLSLDTFLISTSDAEIFLSYLPANIVIKQIPF